MYFCCVGVILKFYTEILIFTANVLAVKICFCQKDMPRINRKCVNSINKHFRKNSNFYSIKYLVWPLLVLVYMSWIILSRHYTMYCSNLVGFPVSYCLGNCHRSLNTDFYLWTFSPFFLSVYYSIHRIRTIIRSLLQWVNVLLFAGQHIARSIHVHIYRGWWTQMSSSSPLSWALKTNPLEMMVQKKKELPTRYKHWQSRIMFSIPMDFFFYSTF